MQPHLTCGETCVSLCPRKGPGGKIPVAYGIFLGSLWNRSGHSGHPGANIPRSLSVERTDRAEYSIFKVLKYFLLYTANMKFSLLVVTHFLRVACKPAAAQRGLGRVPKFAFGYPNAMLAKPSASRWGLLGPSFVPVGEKTGWESESCYDSLSADISSSLRKSES